MTLTLFWNVPGELRSKNGIIEVSRLGPTKICLPELTHRGVGFSMEHNVSFTDLYQTHD